MLLFALVGFVCNAQEIAVRGRISEDSGQPLIGATVALRGTSSGSVTDTDGNFSITVPSESAVLIISYIGYVTQEITVGNQRNLEIVLKLNANLLDETVVVGYGTQEKKDVTGAISTVKGSDIANIPAMGLSQSLQGRAAGVQVVRNGGAPGEGGTIRIRGIGTVNNSDPLIVVDGVPLAFGNINDINPNDIESVNILKDASSSAIYGQRAANGVILITTKRGGFDQKTRLTLNAYRGTSNAIKTIDVLDAPTLASLKRERYTNDGIAVNAIWNESAYQVQRTDWQNELLGQGITQNYDLNLSGGNNRSTFALTGGYFKDEGMMKNSYFERFHFRINSEHKVGTKLKIGENIQLTRQRGNFLNTLSAQTGVLWSAIRFHPSLPVIVTEALPGQTIGNYGSSQASGEFGDINNPIFTVDNEFDEETRNRLLGNLYAEFEILPGLKMRGNFAVDGSIFDRNIFEPIVNTQIRANARNRVARSYDESYALLAEYLLNYDRVFAEKHAVNAVLGYTAQSFVGEGFAAERRDFLNEAEDQRFLSVGTAITDATGTKSENSLASYFGRVNYAFNQKYLLTATLRADGSSKFAPGNKWGYFPAFSAGWRISREAFFQNIKAISHLKLYGGWGQLGNQEVAGLQYLSTIVSGRRYSFGGQQVTGASQGRLPNPEISWETAVMTNFGMEIGLLGNRLLGTFNYFIKNTEDMLLAPPSVFTIGRVTVPNRNVGAVSNQGLEVELAWQKASGAFQYNISGNVSFIKNEVTDLAGIAFLSSTRYGRPNQEIARTYVNEPMAVFYGWKTNGLYQTVEEINTDPALAKDTRRTNNLIAPGDVRFVDLNNDGQINNDDRTILGSPHPDFTYGLNASFSYKGFDFTAFILGVTGGQIYNADRMQGIDPTYPFNMYAETANRWNGAGTSNTIPRMTTRRNNTNHRTSDLFLEDADFLRLKNLTIGYSLPTVVSKKIGIERLRFYATGQNVFTLTNYSGIDPELGIVNGNLQFNVDYAQYPQAQTWIFGLTANF
jgi:TonB-linked SusC/RagA family outer membrane protein